MTRFDWSPEGLGYEHEIGNPQCAGCWREPSGCENHDGGILHNEFGDENLDGDYWLYTKCDVCGESE